MSLARWAKRRDSTEKAIREALLAAGCRVWTLDRPFDLLVGHAGRFTVLECKGAKGRMTAGQLQELRDCQAGGLPVYLVRTPEDALQAVGLIR
jgi:hypothetical protein